MNTVRGVLASVAIAINTVVAVLALFPFAMMKLVIPTNAVRKLVDPILNAIAERWGMNNTVILGDVEWDIRGVGGLERNRWYVVVANHQSWADIFALQKTFNRRIPLLKFFLKQRLIWVPFIGFAWWALDFPFMKRHSQEFLRKYPERRGDDLAAIRRSCEKFSLVPTAVMNFVEGTRFTRNKQNAEGSPYRHLLSPKAGGLALALNAMGEQFHSLIDVTIFYPGGPPTFFEMAAGRMRKVIVNVRELPIPLDLVSGNYAIDPEFRKRAQQWVGELWREKDDLLDCLKQGRSRNAPNERRAVPPSLSS